LRRLHRKEKRLVIQWTEVKAQALFIRATDALEAGNPGCARACQYYWLVQTVPVTWLNRLSNMKAAAT
jgi:hypothetical protein